MESRPPYLEVQDVKMTFPLLKTLNIPDDVFKRYKGRKPKGSARRLQEAIQTGELLAEEDGGEDDIGLSMDQLVSDRHRWAGISTIHLKERVKSIIKNKDPAKTFWEFDQNDKVQLEPLIFANIRTEDDEVEPVPIDTPEERMNGEVAPVPIDTPEERMNDEVDPEPIDTPEERMNDEVDPEPIDTPEERMNDEVKTSMKDASGSEEDSEAESEEDSEVEKPKKKGRAPAKKAKATGGKKANGTPVRGKKRQPSPKKGNSAKKAKKSTDDDDDEDYSGTEDEERNRSEKNGDLVFPCPIPSCKLRFISGQRMKYHLKRKHKYNSHDDILQKLVVSCSVCGSWFRNRSEWRLHQQKEGHGFRVGKKDSVAVNGPFKLKTPTTEEPEAGGSSAANELEAEREKMDSLFSADPDEIIRRRLLIDGDGQGDDLDKTVHLIEVNKKVMERIVEELNSHRTLVAAQREKLAELKVTKQQNVEATNALKLLEGTVGREALELKCKELEAQCEDLKERDAELAAMIAYRKQHLTLLCDLAKRLTDDLPEVVEQAIKDTEESSERRFC